MSTPPHAAPGPSRRAALGAALALAFAAAVSLGLARFSYALLLPPMRADLGWSYVTGGAMNTLNAAGYLLGALLAPQVLARLDARTWMLAGGFGAALLLAAHGLARGDAALGLLRLASGVASAASFVGGGLLAARLAGAQPERAGLLLGIYYGGVGLGIVGSALLVPALAGAQPAGWPRAWLGLGAAALLATLLTLAGTRTLVAPPARSAVRVRFDARRFLPALAGYALFGVGYIGYMTFVISLLREQGQTAAVTTAFYVLLGAAVVASPWLWAGLLQRHRSGRPLAQLNALLALATVLPVLWPAQPGVFLSGLLFGAVFLSVVASTTALVRHNCAPAAWPAGIAAFTIVFAGGQIVGPVLVGLVADRAAPGGGADAAGGLELGFVVSAAALALGSALAALQRPLPAPAQPAA
ncbi:MAG: YbfB/YjiJ family MFS transporter [Pseudomonadota bacterium]|jgi:predicted MFS family arabinose efflux permease|nr:YbfB/YjiJ family MFS transporter [Rubrivivax sp.]MCA3257721.1 YbfB/YjiJ family MFS transporter [Rubrivivax sp.]MCZ8032426.1 YbfB/YjiJ family MFS transporter [Rubrivivax sp.]